MNNKEQGENVGRRQTRETSCSGHIDHTRVLKETFLIKKIENFSEKKETSKPNRKEQGEKTVPLKDARLQRDNKRRG